MATPTPSSSHRLRHSPALPSSTATDPAAADVEALRPLLEGGPLSILLETAGHDRGCLLRFRSGKELACSCDRSAPPLDAAATAIGIAIRYARMLDARNVPMPLGIVTGLTDLAGQGNAAAATVLQWLERRGQIRPAADAFVDSRTSEHADV